jgi:uncharacterized protein (DUF362 family)/Pyruvate/2-oxoacid:ferredoxin oxidoreductase delta subunit
MSAVSLVRCEDYDRQRVEVALRACLQALGGMDRFVHPGDRVLIKPNLLRASKPEAAIVTHPEVVRAAVRLAQGAGGVVTIVDSPGGPANESLMRRAYHLAGWEAVAEETGATLSCNFTSALVPSPDGQLIKRFDVLEEVTKADCVITIPKLKTHGLVRLTGATKILFGVVPGLLKMGYHNKLQTAAAFSEMLLDLLSLVKPRLAIMDAVVGMEGNGPSAGSPRQIGAIAASANSVALDVVCAHLIGLSARDIPLLAAAVRRGLTTGRLEDITVLGEPVDRLRVPDFKTPPGNPDAGMFPAFLPQRLRSWVTGELLERPMASPDRCTGCQTCMRGCPVQAITMKAPVGKRIAVAVMDADICIRCYCCHELCPENAIDLCRGRLGRLLIH